MFAGIGGMGHGLMEAGWECVGYAEWDKFAHQAYEILHDHEKRMWSAYDVTKVTDDDLRLFRRERGDISLLAGGFPCQSFSIAGKRQGFRDATRGTLFFEIIRWASILEPEYLLLENVTGLLNHDGGRTFETVLGTLDEMGYVGEWCVLNSAAYVPQNRERVFIIASARGSSGRKIFPFGAENSNSIEVVGRLEGNHDQNSRDYGTGGVAPTLSTMQGGGQEPKILVAGQLDDDTGGTGKIYDPDGIAPTQLAQHGNAVTKIVIGATNTNLGKPQKIVNTLQARDYKGLQGRQEMSVVLEPIPVLTPDREEKRQNGRRFKEPGEPMFTLTAQDKHGVAIPEPSGIYTGTSPEFLRQPAVGLSRTLKANKHDAGIIDTNYRIRKLTPLECFRLQSFPDEWYYKLKEAGISDSQLYKIAGNAVTSVVAYEIGKRLIEGS
ncbi:DNA (cytosine-5-)-methyltransferase [Paenibacillus sp. WST5]|uniref:Cytosine-specific methyltransferase n=2 Tax=Paenibacillus sedimenti TaxID=2770274 RepID=A0A926KQ25_9BACL|nr:DNA (cytosine-5-)-methyltransferase [Paenibacillus sedimenti]